MATTESGLTPAQKQALVLAVASAYYDVPAPPTLETLSEAHDGTQPTVPQRLNRRRKALVHAPLLSPV